MPDFPVIDAHLHVWDPRRLRYSWQQGNALFDRPWLIEDYAAATGRVQIEAMVFVECFADPGQYIAEVEFVEEQAARDPRLAAIVPMAPLELGAAAEPVLAEMTARFPRVRGIRRIIEFDPDPEFCLRPAFIEGVRLLRRFGLHFEINVNYRQMDKVLAFTAQVPDVPMILDHCGKPGIREGFVDLYRRHIGELARRPNVVCKLSDLPVEADWASWTDAEIRPFIDATLEAFGVERIIYAADWPVCLQAASIEPGVELLDQALAGLTRAERRKIFRDNANAFYRLGLPAA